MTLPTEERDQILTSLTSVGANKPVGYLPLYTVRVVLEACEDLLIAEARSRGLDAVSLGPEKCCIKSGAVYVFDRHALRELLSASAHTLKRCRVATEPDEFVLQIAAIWFEPSHAAYPIIAAAFGRPV
jgi:hypothetical protein